jgi:NAD(P)H-hydrate epimerase
MAPRDDLPSALYDAAQVRGLDARLIAAGTDGFILMQRAAHAVWRALRRRWPQAEAITVLAGRGNNAGDGYLVAALARRAGWRVRVLAVGAPEALQSDARQAYEEACSAGVPVETCGDCPVFDGVLIDALLGTGLKAEVREPYASLIRLVNASGLPVLAIDVPSGLDASTGRQLGEAISAELTVTFIGLKVGLFTGDGPDLTGELVFDDLQADPVEVARGEVLAERLVGERLPRLAPRKPTAHKGQFGHVLVVGGDHGTGGASLLTSEAALRTGAGMVSLASRGEHTVAAQARLPEVMSRGVASGNELQRMIDKADVLVVGPGLGQAAWGRALLATAAAAGRPQVWDADALNLLAAGAVALPADAVITPHPGEAARLLGQSIKTVQGDRIAAVRALAQRYRCVVVLKGAGSLIGEPDGRLALCDRGHPAMASAGLGDVLAGVIGALRGQGLAAYEAACLGVWLHARAGEQLGRFGRGLAAGDLTPCIRELLEEHCACRS